MSRLPPIAPSNLTPLQLPAHKTTEDLIPTMYPDNFTATRKDGALEGPFAPLLYNPSMVIPFFNVSRHVLSLPSLPQSRAVHDLAIIATGAAYGTSWQLYSQSSISTAHRQLIPEQIAQACRGTMPEGLSGEESLAYEFAFSLARRKGPLDDSLWERARKTFGREGVAALTHLVGCYAYLCLVLNAADVEIPKDADFMMDEDSSDDNES